jgi:hypothetical protein
MNELDESHFPHPNASQQQGQSNMVKISVCQLEHVQLETPVMIWALSSTLRVALLSFGRSKVNKR